MRAKRESTYAPIRLRVADHRLLVKLAALEGRKLVDQLGVLIAAASRKARIGLSSANPKRS